MSTTPFPGPYPTTIAQLLAHHATQTPSPRSSDARRPNPWRQPSPTQGRALEILGHAVEYLVDNEFSEEFKSHDQAGAADARHILMRLSCEVFAECRVTITIQDRIRHLFKAFTASYLPRVEKSYVR